MYIGILKLTKYLKEIYITKFPIHAKVTATEFSYSLRHSSIR